VRKGKSKRRTARRVAALEQAFRDLRREAEDNARALRFRLDDVRRDAEQAAKDAEHVRKQWHFVNAHLGSIERRLTGLTGKVYRPDRGEESPVGPELAAFARAEGLVPTDASPPSLDNKSPL